MSIQNKLYSELSSYNDTRNRFHEKNNVTVFILQIKF